jgi:hypothetical protein
MLRATGQARPWQQAVATAASQQATAGHVALESKAAEKRAVSESEMSEKSSDPAGRFSRLCLPVACGCGLPAAGGGWPGWAQATAPPPPIALRVFAGFGYEGMRKRKR